MCKKDVIVACDFKNRRMTMEFLKKFRDRKPFLKIGMELFYGEGPDIVREIRDMGHDIFLDLKLMDIPNTVCGAMKNIAKLGVRITNLHASGGAGMMRAAAEGLREGSAGACPRLIAVTVLTSLGEQDIRDELGIGGGLSETVLRYAENAKRAGLDGVVCSPLEAGAVKERCGAEFLAVTPGIRYPGAEDDQARVTTPLRARALGSDYIVVGRPVTAADDPAAAYAKITREFLEEA